MFKKRKLQKHREKLLAYIEKFRIVQKVRTEDPQIQYSRKMSESVLPPRKANPRVSGDCDPFAVHRAMRSLQTDKNTHDVLDEVLGVLNENTEKTFVDCLLAHIAKTGWKDSVVYKRAQVDKRLFSKIASNRHYQPSKDTAIALAIGLKLPLPDVQDLLSRAGYTLSHSSTRDLVIEYFIQEGVYNMVYINDVLYELGFRLIGHS